MKHKVKNLVLIALGLSVLIFVVAFLTADRARYHNSFVRTFPSHAADEFRAFHLAKGASIAGIDNQGIYLRKATHLTILSTDMLDTCSVSLENAKGYDVIVDSSSFFLQSGVASHFQRGDKVDWTVDTTFTGLPEFTAIQPVSEKTAVLRVIDVEQRKNLLIKTNTPGLKKDVLEKQVDGILCTDGYLLYSKHANIVVYVYRYRNQFLCLDTSLNIIRKGNTIDTTTVARISVVETGGRITMSKPPFIVNKSACVDGKYLFVHSKLVARNELIEDVTDKSTIDVYNIIDGSYRFSFYVNDYSNTKMDRFRVKNKMLFALFPHHVVRYDLASKYLQD